MAIHRGRTEPKFRAEERVQNRQFQANRHEMETLTIVGAAAVFALCLLVRRYGRFLYLTAKVPSPSLWDFVVVHAKELLSDNVVYYVQSLSTAYRHKPWGMWTFRGFVVVVSDCDSVRDIYTAKSLYSKPDMFYKPMSQYTGRGLVNLNGEDYKRHRKIAGPAYRKNVVDSHLHQIIALTNEFMAKLRGIANGEEVDVRPLVQEHSATISTSLFSDGYLPIPRLLPMYDVIEDALVECQLQSLNPVYYHLWHKFKKSTRGFMKHFYAVMAEAKQMYDDEKLLAIERMKKKVDKKPTCAEDVMTLAYLTRGEDGTVDEEGFSETITILTASQDTTSFILNTCLLLIALHPEVQQRIFEEIDSVFGRSLRPVEHEDLVQLDYLEMAIKETLRIFPAAPIIGRKAEEDTNIGGVTVPKGCTVLINIFGLHRNPDIYKDPLKFDPSRFSPELSAGRNSYAYIPFSAGFRNCPGQLQALLTLKTTLCYVCREFELLPGASLKSIDDIRPVMHLTFHFKKSCLRFVRRSNS